MRLKNCKTRNKKLLRKHLRANKVRNGWRRWMRKWFHWRSKNTTINFTRYRVWQKIKSWSSKFLSRTGREIMIKFALLSILSYVMSIFLLRSSLIDAIEKMLIAFWWGHNGSFNEGINWMLWDKLSVHKNYKAWDSKTSHFLMQLCSTIKDGNFKSKITVVCHVSLK